MKVAEFCAHALMSLEVVIHPRALPHDGLPSLNNLFPESNSLASQNHYTPNLNNLYGIAHDSDDMLNRWAPRVDVPSNDEIQRTLDTTLPVQEAKRLKLGNDLATVVSLSVQDHTDTVASENVQQADVPEQKVPESTEASPGHGSDKDATTIPKDGYGEVASRIREGEDLAVKDCLMEEAAIGKKRESLDESDDDSVPSLQEDDFYSDSDSDIES